MSRNKSRSGSKIWLQRHRNDTWVKKSRAEGFRSRAVYKLQHIDQQFRLLKPGITVVDLGAAPGGWAQYCWQKMQKQGVLVTVDLLAMPGIDGVYSFQGDFSSPEFNDFLQQYCSNSTVDLVISDAAPNITGIRDVDEARGEELLDSVRDFSTMWLKPGGGLVLKLFTGSAAAASQKSLRRLFRQCRVVKPEASRSGSREFYLYCQGRLVLSDGK